MQNCLARAGSIAHVPGMRGPRLAAPWIAIAWVAATADASPDLIAERAVVVGRVDDGPWTDAPTEARADPDGPFHGGPDGQLDGFDPVIHMGHPRVLIEPLARHAPATIDVLRWRSR